MRLCLDTSAYSHFKRGDGRLVDVIDAAEWLGICTVVLGELRTGFALGRRARDNERELGALLRNPVVEILDVDEATSKIYAELVVALRQAGTPLPTNDIWIAASAMAAGATVITCDAHFAAIQGVGSRVFSTEP